MPELERYILHRLAEIDAGHPRGLCRLRLQKSGRAALRLHDRRSVGLLFRHPQGWPLLRSALQRDPQGGADRHRHSLRRAAEMAGARSCASPPKKPGSPSGPTARNRCTSPYSRPGLSFGATRRWRPNGAAFAGSAPWSPGRWRSNARKRPSAPRSKPTRRCSLRMRACALRSKAWISPISASLPRSRSWPRRRRKAPSPCRRHPASGSSAAAPRGANARGPGGYRSSSAPIPNSPT